MITAFLCFALFFPTPPSTPLHFPALLTYGHLNFSLLNFSLTLVQEVNGTLLSLTELVSLRNETDL